MGKSRNNRETNFNRFPGETNMTNTRKPTTQTKPELVEVFDFEAAYKAAQIEIAASNAYIDELKAQQKQTSALSDVIQNGLKEFAEALPPQIQLLLQNPQMAAVAVQAMLDSAKAELSENGFRVCIPTPFGALRAEAYLDLDSKPHKMVEQAPKHESFDELFARAVRSASN